MEKEDSRIVLPEFLTEEQNIFLSNYTASGNLKSACEMSKVSGKKLNSWLSGNYKFAKVLQDIANASLDRMTTRLKEAAPEIVEDLVDLMKTTGDERLKATLGIKLLELCHKVAMVNEFALALESVKSEKTTKVRGEVF